MKLQLIRHATLIISINNKRILVDPMLSKKGSLPPIKNVANQNYNPLVELPIDINAVTSCDAVLVTHTHRDHFDHIAAALLPKNIPVLCQPEDEVKLQDYGFTNICPVKDTYVWNDIRFNRTKGKHGHGILAMKMAPVSGFVISYREEASAYIAGDTVFCRDVKKSIEKYKPEIIVCNAGAASFHFGKPITMAGEDIQALCKAFPYLKIAAVHMEAWNHCSLTRKALKDFIYLHNLKNKIYIPEDGQVIDF